jgi:hypothetical protein
MATDVIFVLRLMVLSKLFKKLLRNTPCLQRVMMMMMMMMMMIVIMTMTVMVE